MPSNRKKPTVVPPRAIIDIGSNTVRLVIYGGPLRAPEVLHNEKVTAKLGKGVAENGLLSGKASAMALASLARYRALLRLKGVDQVDVVATAAARDATNGAAFLDAVREIGFAPRLLSGEQEAVTSAHGVIAAFPGARGVVGDLGGGSLELVDIDGESCTHGVSMPLGTLRLPALRAGGDAAFAQRVGKALDKAQWSAEPGCTLYLVGGSLRAFARHAMIETQWPIDDPHGFAIDAVTAERLAKALARMKGDMLTPVQGISGSRLTGLPDAAALIATLIKNLQPSQLVFSAWGLREGVLWDSMPAFVRTQDPLVAGVSNFVRDEGVSPGTATMVAGWTASATRGDVSERRERLRLAATMLCLASATVEPNLRPDLSRNWALRKRWIGASARARAMLAAAMVGNNGKTDLPPELARIADEGHLREALAWGLATRLCRRLSGCSAQGLTGSALRIEGNAAVLEVAPDLAVLVNDGVERDLKALAQHMGLKAVVR
ncbi:exopolyphosphatase [Novosphingobium sp. KCTC 2891]|uniref:Ppx/GppA phosphatase family protein n=1 Tax=Novosphingobium sp. KCTC 2891 TaxID=2989730 RepID=UPI00222321CA|nr:exopolyphosphatase [Novosphingobium sp. KCTC 2891]MCW1383402.1 exopolyphosphatase [Novosphingobium sp. KCTC 2891]